QPRRATESREPRIPPPKPACLQRARGTVAAKAPAVDESARDRRQDELRARARGERRRRAHRLRDGGSPPRKSARDRKVRARAGRQAARASTPSAAVRAPAENATTRSTRSHA